MRLDLTGPENIIRVCVRVADEDHPAPSSVPVPCAECDTPVWRSTRQKMRNPETGEELTETHCLCVVCFMMHSAVQDEAPTLIPPNIEDLVEELFSEDEHGN